MQRGENIGLSAITASQIRETFLTWMVPFIGVIICSFSRSTWWHKQPVMKEISHPIKIMCIITPTLGGVVWIC